MTSRQRPKVPDDIQTNGATPNPWWANAVVYQIYPRSFQDTNGDGYGDIPGIARHLDYLAELGVDAIWLSPVYQSPQDDNGYDISDYRRIDPMFGSLEDMDELIAQAHNKGIRVIMDLVVNHTSDEHAWFQASRNRDPAYADWYWWRPARPGHEPGTPGAEPNKWGGSFGGSAWQYDPVRGEYYLHIFSRKQPDLNWENPAVRKAVYQMMNWWMDRGIDGFRMDVITLISKLVDAQGHLPGECGGSIPDNPPGEEGYSSPWPFCMDGPRLDEFLKEMRQAVFNGRQGYLTVGEGQGITAARSGQITDPASGELDMLFLFDHMEVDQAGAKWNQTPLHLCDLKKAMFRQQESVSKKGWASLYFNNHDQPRIVSRWGDTSTDELRVRSAKALALLLHMHRGTPYIYQGEELGMTNAGFTRLDQYRDLESINAFHQRVEEAHVQDADSMMSSLAKAGRDNARTPMQWDGGRYAGFMTPEAAVEPWIAVNPNKSRINAASEVDDPDSVFSFYKRLIDLRHRNPVISAGSFQPVDVEDEYVYAFVRVLGDRRLLTVVNVSSQQATLPAQTTGLLNGNLNASRLVISNLDGADLMVELARGILPPWAAFAIGL
ncbi:MAG: alpha-glucosidase [Bifidobacteriales bacterium]|uniref:glycoside hydrolase family 13 protein n=1 Tax=Bifidobacterium polysaccharolyticum TaxID=2750967 RepID=UPI0018DE5203|nr:alpha-glucosidase [Bifidobacterium polysaccharolyticum]MBI0063976.1 alpha-glucosidase [Bifidobacterium polysaccharolyticum]MCT6836424.1 alpha-glucosidase [Bifidobacteriales bacterium]